MNLLKTFFQFQLMLNKAPLEQKFVKVRAICVKTDLKQQELKELNQSTGSWIILPFTEEVPS